MMRQDSRVKVCMVTSRFFPNYGGGVKQSLLLCQKLQQRGISPFVVTFNHNVTQNSGMLASEMVAGIRVVRLSPLTKWKTWTRYVNLLDFLIRHRRNYDVLHVHGVDRQAYLATLAAQLIKKKVIAKITSYGADDPETILNSKGGIIKAKILSLMDTIICPADHLFTRAIDAGLRREQLAIIPNGVDEGKFKPLSPIQRAHLRRKLGMGEREFIIVFSGALQQVKGVDVLVKAFTRLAVRDGNPKLVLVGPCDRKEHWGINEEYIKALHALADQVRNKIIFTGYIHHVHEYLQVADAFVLPSWREGLSNALLEAMACRLSVIATRVPSNKEIIQEGENGFLFHPGNIDDLTTKLLQLIEDSVLRDKIGSEARKTILESFSIDDIADKYVKLYWNVLSN